MAAKGFDRKSKNMMLVKVGDGVLLKLPARAEKNNASAGIAATRKITAIKLVSCARTPRRISVDQKKLIEQNVIPETAIIK